MISLFSRFISWILSFFSREALDLKTSDLQKYKKVGGEASEKVYETRTAKVCGLGGRCLAERPMYVSEGQIAYSHKQCRTTLRRLQRI